MDSDAREAKRARMGVANSGYFQPGPMNSLFLFLYLFGHRLTTALSQFSLCEGLSSNSACRPLYLSRRSSPCAHHSSFLPDNADLRLI